MTDCWHVKWHDISTHPKYLHWWNKSSSILTKASHIFHTFCRPWVANIQVFKPYKSTGIPHGDSPQLLIVMQKNEQVFPWLLTYILMVVARILGTQRHRLQTHKGPIGPCNYGKETLSASAGNTGAMPASPESCKHLLKAFVKNICQFAKFIEGKYFCKSPIHYVTFKLLIYYNHLFWVILHCNKVIISHII